MQYGPLCHVCHSCIQVLKMKTYLDCVPCIMKQAVEAPLRFTSDSGVRERIVRRTAEVISTFDMTRSPPEMGGALNRIMAEELGIPDPYLGEKRRFNQLAMELMPRLRLMLDGAPDRFEAAVRLAIAGNVIDFGAPAGETDGDLMDRFNHVMTAQLHGEGAALVARLAQMVTGAEKILYLADNTGEIVVDRLLVEMLPAGKVTVVVRSGPAINDALLEDASFAGLDELASVMESGAALPGTPLAQISDEFRRVFAEADVIISKGQGNFETLCDEDAPIFFLLMAKCPVVARQIGCSVGDYVVTAPRMGRPD